jgi:hypothetical protein
MYVIPPRGQTIDNLIRGRSSLAGQGAPAGRTALGLIRTAR